MKRKAAVIIGTRPEAIKLCPVVLALRRSAELEPHVCVTGQHRTMVDQILPAFGVTADADLAVMAPNQTLAGLSARLLAAVDAYLAEVRPDIVLVQGDTTTALCAALAAFYRAIPVAHVEAGLRTGDLRSPFPEEANRVLVGRIADLHFPPTDRARAALEAEGIPADRLLVTGNTVIDALQLAVGEVRRRPPAVTGVPEPLLASERRLVLVTGHRRESFGAGFESICGAIRRCAERFPEVAFVYPVHLNPNVREPVNRILGGVPNVLLVEPVNYLEFVRLMDRATLILTDSGGVQEEAPTLHKPVLVMRDTTERPEAVEAGVARLVGTREEAIVEGVTRLLTDAGAYAAMARGANPFGDGAASDRIVARCAAALRARAGREGIR